MFSISEEWYTDHSSICFANIKYNHWQSIPSCSSEPRT